MVTEADKRTDLPPRKEKAAVAVKAEEVKTEVEVKSEEEVKKDEAEGIVKIEGGGDAVGDGAEVKEEEGAGAAMEVDDDDEEEEPIWKEDIGWREVCGFLVM